MNPLHPGVPLPEWGQAQPRYKLGSLRERLGLEPPSERDLVSLREFERTMQDEVIPQIVQDIYEREQRAKEVRRWVLLGESP